MWADLLGQVFTDSFANKAQLELVVTWELFLKGVSSSFTRLRYCVRYILIGRWCLRLKDHSVILMCLGSEARLPECPSISGCVAVGSHNLTRLQFYPLNNGSSGLIQLHSYCED